MDDILIDDMNIAVDNQLAGGFTKAEAIANLREFIDSYEMSNDV